MVDARLADASFPITIDKQQFLCSMLCDRDYGDLQEWAQSRFIKMATDAARRFDDVTKREVIAVALKEAIKILWGTDECDNLIWTPDGMKQLALAMIRKRHPSVKLEQLSKSIDNDKEEAYESIYVAYKKLNFNLEEKEASGGASTENSKSSDEGRDIPVSN